MSHDHEHGHHGSNDPTILHRAANLHRPQTHAEVQAFFNNIQPESKGVFTELKETMQSVGKALVDLGVAPLALGGAAVNAVTNAVGNLAALPSVGILYLGRAFDYFKKRIVDDTRDKLHAVLEGDFGGGGGHGDHGHGH